MTNHTTGPWLAHGEPEATEIRARGGAKIICDTDAIPHANMPEAIANARLIAAAPDLLSRLEDAAFLMGKLAANWKEAAQFRDSLRRSAEDAREAIAKAKGGRLAHPLTASTETTARSDRGRLDRGQSDRG